MSSTGFKKFLRSRGSGGCGAVSPDSHPRLALILARDGPGLRLMQRMMHDCIVTFFSCLQYSQVRNWSMFSTPTIVTDSWSSRLPRPVVCIFCSFSVSLLCLYYAYHPSLTFDIISLQEGWWWSELVHSYLSCLQFPPRPQLSPSLSPPVITPDIREQGMGVVVAWTRTLRHIPFSADLPEWIGVPRGELEGVVLWLRSYVGSYNVTRKHHSEVKIQPSCWRPISSLFWNLMR